MIDITPLEAKALLALIEFEQNAHEGATLPADPLRDVELRSAARKLARPTTTAARIKANSASRDGALEERTLMLGWIVRHLLPKGMAHLSPAHDPGGVLPVAVCIHGKRGPMAWRISGLEAEAYFSQLPTRECEHGAVKRADKLARLADLASR